MEPTDAQRYCELMAEIKARSNLIMHVGEGRVGALPTGPRVEFVYLQLRKIIELIAMGSLLANASSFAHIQSKIEKYWNAKDLLNDIQTLNPDFYPRPIIQKASTEPGVKMQWLDRRDDFLTKERFITLYDKCGSILHVRNPFVPEQDFGKFEKAAPKWYLWIVNLLNAHIIRLIGGTKLYLIQMGSDVEPPTYTIFVPSTRRPRGV